MTMQAIEKALDEGRIDVLMSHGKWWQVRRNGKTQTWKTRPGEFRIPIKAGFRTCGEITHRTDMEDDFRIREAV